MCLITNQMAGEVVSGLLDTLIAITAGIGIMKVTIWVSQLVSASCE